MPPHPSPIERLHLRALKARKRAWQAAGLFYLAWLAPMAVWANDPPQLPSFAELEAAGATIGEIRVLALDIFDTADPRDDKWLFRRANALHIQTRKGVIERQLLFRSGEKLQRRRIEETERQLRSNRYLYDVQLRPVAWRKGVVDIEVLTRDSWSLDPGFSVGRSGGKNSSGIHLKEYNLLGTGTAISIARTRNVDRSSNQLQFSNDRAFGTQWAVSTSHITSSDGSADAFTVAQPFHGLDSRWSAGISASREVRIDSNYQAGQIVSQYRHALKRVEGSYGWSTGVEQGWVRRMSLGLSYQDDAFDTVPGPPPPPARLPSNITLATPFVRYDLIEDRFEKELNRNLIGRPEFFSLGLVAHARLGVAGREWGSSRNAWVYDSRISRGFEPWPGHTLITSASVNGQWSGGRVKDQLFNAQAQYYLPQGKRWLFYASAQGDRLMRADLQPALLLGGDNGLRGFPLRYQSGTRRALVTVEERFFTDWYVWRLFHIGGAAFLDVGRAWNENPAPGRQGGWLADTGLGLRIVNARAAFSNVLHIDLAYPLNAPSGVKGVQLLLKTKASF